MEITHQKSGDVNIVTVIGKLDSNTSTEFESKLLSIIDAGECKIVLNCEKLDYISSAGLRVLLFAAKKLKGCGGKIVLTSLKEHIKEVFEISGFTGIFSIYASDSEALNVI